MRQDVPKRAPKSIFRLRFLAAAFLLSLIFTFVKSKNEDVHSSKALTNIFFKKLNKSEVANILGKRMPIPSTTDLFSPAEILKLDNQEWSIQYTHNAQLQKAMTKVFQQAQIPYGAFVAIDPQTGRILSMVSHGMENENLALRATFPAASVFKVVTAAAAIEGGKLRHNSLIPILGSFHTLYKRNLFAAGGLDPSTSPRYAHLMSFADALAKSVNSIFGKVGIFGLGSEGIRKAALQFAFNQDIPFEMPVDMSKVTVPDDLYGIAESASGFTKLNTMSPLHGSLIAAAIANQGVIMEPTIVDSIQTKDGNTVYESMAKPLVSAIDERTAKDLKIMLNRTITAGTSRSSFRGASRSPALSDVYMGGKTGTLDGWDPPGRYDWFVGFAELGNRKIAISALCIHGNLRGMKASKVARIAFETYFKNQLVKNAAR